jgi:acylphosphatase
MIRGVVQGVSYRAWTQATAARLGLRGWVRNRRDGSVEALFVGPPAQVEAMLAACQRGPPEAQVESVTPIAGAEPEAPVTDFQILPTV